ncbi:MAG: OmpA family protein [Ignavibacteria bacterium]|nr:OmpA family protein [Ignavibacteria bacterium]
MLIKLFGLFFVHMLISAEIISQDLPGSKDYPVISRFPGSLIEYYEEQKYSIYTIAEGPVTGYKTITDQEKVEGEFTRIYYSLKGTITLTEIYRNYITAFNEKGFTYLAEGVDDKRNVSGKVGGKMFLDAAYMNNPFPSSSGIKLLHNSATSGGSFYIAASQKRDNSVLYIIISGNHYSNDEKVLLMDVIETTKMDDGQVVIDAREMLKGIKAEGKIALYGIHFDVNRYEVKPDSKPALDEIAKLLQENTGMNIYIVGHTDMDGTFEHNMQLSQNRAESIVNELVSKYSVDPSRVTAKGVGPLAPVSSNSNDAGKTLNRRVELVEK